LLLEGRRVQALDFLKRAALASFLPAELDAGRFMWQGWGVDKPSGDVADRLLRKAEMHGHKAARLLRYERSRQSAAKPWRRLLGYMIVPFLKVKLVWDGTKDPFSEAVFFVDSGEDARMFHCFKSPGR
jgi:hypothetical protein